MTENELLVRLERNGSHLCAEIRSAASGHAMLEAAAHIRAQSAEIARLRDELAEYKPIERMVITPLNRDDDA